MNYPSRDNLVIDGVEMTAQNIWKDKDKWIGKVFEHYRKAGFPFPQMTKEEISKELKKLKAKKASECLNKDGELNNSSSLCLDVSRFINNNCYWKCSGGKTPSIYDAFMDDETLMKVLKNRMGYSIGKNDYEDSGVKYKAGTPYLFDMSDKQLFQGFRSSRIGFATSNFKPIVAKYLIEKYCDGDKVLDPSIGWSVRYMASNVLGKTYYGIDPAEVSKNTENFARSIGDNESMFVTGGSEIADNYKDFPEVDYVIACPPYFTLESYDGSGQSIDSFSNYDKWLENYWKPTVKNCYDKLKVGGKFTLIMIEDFEGHKLLKDMTDIMRNIGFKDFDTISYKTSRSHLNKKAGNTKNSEKCVTMVK